MRKAEIYQQGRLAGWLEEIDRRHYRLPYAEGYEGEPVSLTMPIEKRIYDFAEFPPVLEGLLPEGFLLEALLRQCKVDRDDLLSQLLLVGEDVVGSLQIRQSK